MQQPGESGRPSRLLAYVVSWLNEAQMKPLCPSELSVGSWGSISPSNPLSTLLLEVGGLWARVNPWRSPLPPSSAPRVQAPRSHSSWWGTSAQTGSADAPPRPSHRSEIFTGQRFDDGSPSEQPDPCRHCCLYVVNFKSTQQNKNSWRVDALLRAASRLAAATSQSLWFPFLLVNLFKAFGWLDAAVVKSDKTRLFRFRPRTIGQLHFLSRHEELFWLFHWVKCKLFFPAWHKCLTTHGH